MIPTPRYVSDDCCPFPLTEPLQFSFSHKTSPNRFCKAATTERLASWDPHHVSKRGVPSEDFINLYRRWGEGGMGMLITGNIMIELGQLEATGNPIIPRGTAFSGDRFTAFQNLAEAGKANGSLMIGQVSHPGRQAKSALQKDPVSASDLQLKDNVMGTTFERPHAASKEEIQKIVEGFAYAAEFLWRAGFDGIQLHGAHGYLLSQFLSPTTNQRPDEYGGSLENRSRLIMEIAQAIQKRVPSTFSISVKLNCVEFQHGGFDVQDCKKLCTKLEDNRFDFVELSGGTYEELAFAHKRDSTRKREAFFLELAEVIVPSLTKTKTYITGGFRTVGGMVNALKTVDGIGLVRSICQEPRLCADISSGRVKGAVKQRIGEDDIGLTSAAAGAQLDMIARDLEPINLGKEQEVEAFMKDLTAWIDEMAHDEALVHSGWARILGINSKQYDSAALL